MGDGSGAAQAQATIVSWGDDGTASLEAAGSERRSTIEAGLRAALTLVLGSTADERADDFSRQVPLRGEGDDLPALFADLLADLFALLEEHGAALRTLDLDGVLQRERGGFIAWGYASLADGAWPKLAPPRLIGAPRVTADQSRIIICASFVRGP